MNLLQFKSIARIIWAWLRSKTRSVWAWLLNRWLYVIIACVVIYLIVGALGVVKTEETKQVAQKAVDENVLTRRQVKAKDKVIAAQKDSIRIVTIYKDRWRTKSDSTAVLARKSDTKVDSLLKAKQAPMEANPTAEYLTEQLNAYKPTEYDLPRGSTIR